MAKTSRLYVIILFAVVSAFAFMTQTSWIRSNEVEVHYSLLQKDFKKVSLELQRLKKKEEEGISQRTLQPECKQKPPQEYTIQICVFTYNRIVGLKRLWKSLVSADYQGDDVPLTIFFDRKDEDRDETEDWVKTLKWPHGKLRIHRRDSNTGLKKSIMEAWYPTSDPNTFAVFFEDDIEASTLWYKWSIAAIKEYALRDDRDEKLLGISLYRPIHDEMVGKKFHPDTNGDPYLFQQPCSWGAIYFPGPWARFRDWYLAGEKMHDPIAKGFGLPRISSNTWSHKSSWKKYLIKYMWLKGIFMVYPNPPNRTVLSTNHLMKGEHPTPKRELFELPLLTSELYNEQMKNGHDVLRAPPLQKLKAFDLAIRSAGTGPKGIPQYDVSYEDEN